MVLAATIYFWVGYGCLATTQDTCIWGRYEVRTLYPASARGLDNI